MYMMQLYLIEERHFSRHRMPQHTAALLPHSQIVLAVPLRDETLLPTRFLDNCAVFGMEEFLPAHIQPVGEIPYVHQPQLLELFPHRWIQIPVYLAGIHHWRAPTLFRRGYAEKTDSRRPRIHVRALVVKQNHLVFRIRRRVVNLPRRTTLTRQIAVFVINLFVDGGCN